MARVPVYGPQKVTLNPTAAPGITPQRRTNDPATYGVAVPNAGAVGRAASQVGNAMLRLADDFAATEAEDALTRFEKERNEILYNAESGYFNKKGRAAYDNVEPTREQLDQVRRAYSDGIKSANARSKFDRASESLLIRDQESINRYAGSQFNAWKAAVSQTRAENALEEAPRIWNNAEELGVQLQVGRQAVIDAGQAGGKDAELINSDIKDFDSAFYKNVILAAVQSSATDGEAVLNEFDGYLSGVDMRAMQRAVQQKKDQEKTQAVAGEAVTRATNLVNDYWWYPDARNLIINEAQKITDPEVMDKTITESMQLLNQRLQGRAEERNAAWEQAQNFLLGGGTVGQLQAQSPATWETLAPEQKIKLLTPGSVQTDLETWTQLQLNMTPDDLQNLTPEQLTVLSTQLSATDYKSLVNTIKGLREGDDETRLGWTRGAQAAAVMNQIFGKKPNYEEQRAFYDLLNSEYATAKREKGRDLNYDETEQLYNKLSASYLKENWTFLGYTSTSEYTIDDVPAGMIREISDILRSSGKDVSGPAIAEFYQLNKKSLEAR